MSPLGVGVMLCTPKRVEPASSPELMFPAVQNPIGLSLGRQPVTLVVIIALIGLHGSARATPDASTPMASADTAVSSRRMVCSCRRRNVAQRVAIKAPEWVHVILHDATGCCAGRARGSDRAGAAAAADPGASLRCRPTAAPAVRRLPLPPSRATPSARKQPRWR